MKASERLMNAGGSSRGLLKTKEPVKPACPRVPINNNTPRAGKGIATVGSQVKTPGVTSTPKRTIAKVNDINSTTRKAPLWTLSTIPKRGQTPVAAARVPSTTTPKCRPGVSTTKTTLSRLSTSENSIDTVGQDTCIRNVPNEADKDVAKKGGVSTSHSVDSLDTHLLKTEKQQQTAAFYATSDGTPNTDSFPLHQKIEELKEKIVHRDQKIERLELDFDSLQQNQKEEIKQYRQKIASLELANRELEKELKYAKDHAACSVSTIPASDEGKNIQSIHSSSDDGDVLNFKSVACLQTKITQMEETHHSTSEELAATLKELSDSHQCTTELRIENEKLRDENFVLLDSISHLSEKVNFYKTHAECVIGDATSPSSLNIALPDVTNNQRLSSSFAATGEERERNQIEELQSYIKSLRDEKEVLVKKSESLDGHIHQLQQTLETKCNEIAELRQEITNHRMYLDKVMKEKEKVSSDLNELKSSQTSNQIEMQRIQSSYDILKSKYEDLVQQEKTRAEEKNLEPAIKISEDLEELKKQRSQLEIELQNCQEKLQVVLEDVRIRKLEVSDLRNEIAALQTNSKNALKDLEDRLTKSDTENATLALDLGEAHDACHNVEKKYQQEMRDNLRLRNVICQMELELLQWKQQCESLERALSQEKSIISAERDEWQQFQSDLLLVVRAANDFKTEAQETSDRLHKENMILREKANSLENGNTYANEDDVFLFNPSSLPISKVSDPSSIDTIISCTSDDEENQISNLHDISDAADVSIKKTESHLENSIPKSATPERPIAFNKSLSKVTSSTSDVRRNSYCEIEREDPLTALVKITGGSKRNALLKWCQNRTIGYKYIDITNFSTSWNDGMALCALLHTFIPEKISYETLSPENREENFKIAFQAAESIYIETSLDIKEMLSAERPAWEKVMRYVKDIYVCLEGKVTNN